MTKFGSYGKIIRLSNGRPSGVRYEKDFEKSRKKYLTKVDACGKIAELSSDFLKMASTKNFKKVEKVLDKPKKMW